MAETRSAISKGYDGLVKWSRRGSAVYVSFVIVRWLTYGTSPTSDLREWIAPLGVWARLPVDRATIAAMAAWYAFLSQLKIRWAIWLPVYLVSFPAVWATWHVLRLLASPVFRYLKSLGESGAAAVPAAAKKSQWSFPRKRAWLAAFFLWLVVFRGLDVAWAAWVPPVLALPIWFFFLRLCYQFAVTPRTFANVLVSACSSLLDTQIKTLNDARERKTKPTVSTTFAYSMANAILRRYSDERVVSVVQKESLALFSASLLVALAASSGFWALVGTAIRHSSPALDSYAFFSSGSLFETLIWAWGCMTTAISFPGASAPTWLKAVHASILATGLFQLTFLLACFSIMTSSEGARTAAEARKALQIAREKLDQTKALEAIVVTVIDTPTMPEGQ